MPSSTKNLIRFMLALIIILAMAAGFYKSSLDLEKQKYQLLENKMDS
jgi:hypothetical protein